MSTVIIACETIKGEIELAIRETGAHYPLLMVDAALHNYPKRLRGVIQDRIDHADDARTILFAFGFCGNSLWGIKSATARLIIPRAEDCITLLLGSGEIRKRVGEELGTYFLTKGWLENEQNIISEYEICVRRYGNEKALEIMKRILNHYHRLMVIDTKAYKLTDILEKTSDFAHKLGLRHEEYVGSPRYLHKLLLGPWDGEFIILEPGQELTFERINDRQ